MLSGLLREPVDDVDGEYYRAQRRGDGAEAGAGPAADPDRRQGRPHDAASSPATPTSGTCGRARRVRRAVRRRSTRRARDIDRDPATIARSTQALFFLGDDQAKIDALIERVAPRPAVGGTAERLTEAVQGWADVGVDEVIVPDFTLGTGAQRLEALDLIIEQVAPAFR